MTYETGLSVEEKVASLFQPDILLPEQYYATFRRKTLLEPEKRLMLAILEDAVVCFKKYRFASSRKGAALFCEAEAWLFDEVGVELFSFANVCETLGFDPQFIRQGLLRVEGELAKRPKGRVCRLTPRTGRRKAGYQISGTSEQEFPKAAGL